MPSLRRSLLRRYRLYAPHLLRNSLVLLILLLLGDGVAALCFPQIQAALSLSAGAGQPQARVVTPAVAAMTTGAGAAVLASDTFQRANQPYWGTSSDGHVWQADASSARNFSIFAHAGLITSTPPHIYCSAILGPVVADVEITFNAALSQYSASSLGAVLRWSDPNNYYALTLDGQALSFARVMDGMTTPLQMLPFPARSNALYTFRVRAAGTRFFAAVWPTGQPAPANWQIEVTDSALSTGQAGVRALVQNGAQARITAFTEEKL